MNPPEPLPGGRTGGLDMDAPPSCFHEDVLIRELLFQNSKTSKALKNISNLVI